jgi:hypothetical protein
MYFFFYPNPPYQNRQALNTSAKAEVFNSEPRQEILSCLAVSILFGNKNETATRYPRHSLYAKMNILA